MTKNISHKELDRDIANLRIPEEDQHIPLVQWEDLEKIYGKEFVKRQKQKIQKRSEDQ